MTAIERYALETIAHSLVALVVLEVLARMWRAYQPGLRLRFHALALVLPAATVPAFHLVYPIWGSPASRQRWALLDLEGWRTLEVWGWHPVVVGLGIVTAATTALFLVQEVLPAWQLLRWHRGSHPRPPAPDESALVQAATAHLPGGTTLPPVLIADEEAPLAYVHGLGQPTLVLSPALLRLLDSQELAGVLAHEVAHLRRRDNWLGWTLLVVRAAMFYNPVALLVFRHVLHDTELVCDDAAVILTGDRLALASGLLKACRPVPGETQRARWGTWAHARLSALDDRSRQAVVEDRLGRLVHPRPAAPVGFPNVRLGVATAVVVALVFLVV